MIVILVLCLGQVIYGQVEATDTIRISLVGDILLDGTVARYIANNDVDYPWEHVSPIFGASDLVLGNLETSVGTGGQIDVNKQYSFQSKPESLKGMVNGGVDGVSIANNHTLDYGQEGFKQTLDHLEEHGIEYAGGGRDIGAALQPVVWDVKGMKVGFLAFSRVIYDVSWYATEKRPGILSGYDHYAKNVSETIRQARENVDFLIVSVHWGKELAQYPEADEIKFGRMMIDSGADVIMGHHPHVLQGIELYKNKPIVYSLGNFVFNSTSQLSRTSMIFNLEIGSEGITNIYIIPVQINHCRPIPVQGKDGRAVVDLLNRISGQWGTTILESGDVVGNIKYAEQGRPPLSDEVSTVDSRKNESVFNDKRVEKLEKFSRFLGYDFHYDGGTNIAMLMKKNESLSFDYGQEMITIHREKKKILKTLFVYKPLYMLSRLFKWSFQYQHIGE